jgi:hypothetical protein
LATTKAEGLMRSTDEALSWGVCVVVYSTLQKEVKGKRRKGREGEKVKIESIMGSINKNVRNGESDHGMK